MTQSKAHIRASNKYNVNNYDRLAIYVKKGKREELKQHASDLGMSLNAFINYCIEKEINNDTEV